MKQFFLFLAAAIVLTVSSSFQTNTVKPEVSSEPAFKDKEELKFNLHYGFITAGTAVISLKEQQYDHLPCFHAVAKAKTTGLAAKFFKVVDVYESYFDTVTNLPLKTIRNIHEGNYKQYNEVLFDHNNNTVLSQLSGEHKVPARILDMVSSFFYFRRIDFSNFKRNDIIMVNTYFEDEVFPFYVVFKGRETIETDLGKFRCLKFVPVVEPGRIFKDKDDMTFWLTDDQNKIPLRVKLDMIVGSFKCDVVSAKNLKYPMTSKISDD